MLKANVMQFHSQQHRKQFIRATGQYRNEYIKLRQEEKIAHPAAAYAAQRVKQDEQRAKLNIEKPKQTTCPAQPMSSTLVPYVINKNDLEEGVQNASHLPSMSNTHCAVCDVYFCGDIPARQHYDGQKHTKKLNKYKSDNPSGGPVTTVASPADTKPRRIEVAVVTKVGIDLEYCELCEIKLSPNPIQATAHYSSKSHLKVIT